MTDNEKALEEASKKYSGNLRIVSIGENSFFKIITMSNEELDKYGDGFEFPYLVINKETKDELLSNGIGFLEDPRFSNLNLNDLTFTYFD